MPGALFSRVNWQDVLEFRAGPSTHAGIAELRSSARKPEIGLGFFFYPYKSNCLKLIRLFRAKSLRLQHYTEKAGEPAPVSLSDVDQFKQELLSARSIFLSFVI